MKKHEYDEYELACEVLNKACDKLTEVLLDTYSMDNYKCKYNVLLDWEKAFRCVQYATVTIEQMARDVMKSWQSRN